jgi:hypothetical protein
MLFAQHVKDKCESDSLSTDFGSKNLFRVISNSLANALMSTEGNFLLQ